MHGIITRWSPESISSKKSFLSTIGEDGLELFEGMNFDPKDDRKKLDAIMTRFEDLCIRETNLCIRETNLCIRETNETYERCIFNSRNQEGGESIDKYMNALCTLVQSCKFCSCLHDLLVAERERSCCKKKSSCLAERLISAKAPKLHLSR